MSKQLNLASFIKEVFFILSAVSIGISLQMTWFSTHGWNPMVESFAKYATGDAWNYRKMDLRLIATSIALIVVFFILRLALRTFIAKTKKFFLIKDQYKKTDTWTYLIFLLSTLGAFGIFLEPVVLFSAFVLIQVLLIFNLLHSANKTARNESESLNSSLPSRLLLGLFFASGFAALIYQVVWQRILFQSFGVNIESVTIIVSIFMFGLGFGSLVGGYLSKKYLRHQIYIFVVCELAIGLFGLFSINLIQFVASKTLLGSTLQIALTTYALLFIPTTLMGATLPVLVSYLHRFSKNVGETVSFLYFVNTLGSALASFLTVHLLFYYFGLQTSVVIAALFNFVVVYLTLKNFKIVESKETASQSLSLESNKVVKDKFSRLFYILTLSAAIGYISLSQEILWMRFIGYTTGSRPTVFGNLLCFFLMGIAIGSLWAAKICKKYENELLKIIALLLVISSVVYYFTIPFLAFLTGLIGEGAIPIMYFSSGLVALSLGTIFPILTHFAIRNNKAVGESVSLIYFANVIGSTAGPIITGFILLDQMSFTNNVRLLSLLTLLSALAVFFASGKILRFRVVSIAAVIGLIAFEFFIHQHLFNNMYEKLFYKHEYNSTKTFIKTIETRSGVINISPEKTGGDVIVGGGQYDGRFNTDLVADSNVISRAYMFAALHPNPTAVLEIGLSGGAWGSVISGNDKVKSLDIIEINPGYIDLVANYSPYKDLFNNPKIKIHLDDGRRWLIRNPDKKFDFILMNTTFYWRSQISNLVSIEFLELCRRHLNPGGILYYNTTGSPDIPYTAAHVFKYITRFSSFIAVSDTPFPTDQVLIKENLNLFLKNHALTPDPTDKNLLDKLDMLSKSDLSDKRNEILKTSYFTNVITDDNLASEFKTWKKVFMWERNWIQLMGNGSVQ